MEYLTKKLPYILSAVMTLFTGILGFLANKDSNFIYAIMLVSIVIFGAIGFLLREFINAIMENNKKKEEDKAKAKAKAEESIAVQGETDESKGNVIDLKVDDSNDPVISDFYGDGFSPMEVSKVIRTNVNNDK